MHDRAPRLVGMVEVLKDDETRCPRQVPVREAFTVGAGFNQTTWRGAIEYRDQLDERRLPDTILTGDTGVPFHDQLRLCSRTKRINQYDLD
ncbi:hypothetical protein D3C76_681800 [compost metagenome]